MERDLEIAEFNPSDGLTPLQMQKLNFNFRHIRRGFALIGDPTVPYDLDNYDKLKNKPKIEGVTLEGDKTYEQLNLVRLTNTQIEYITST